jgi:hypothetical protein
MLAGFGNSARTYLSDALSPLGLVPLEGGGSAGHAGRAAPAAPFVDGGAIGVQLVRGDIVATAIGTITHVDENRLIAFGHPMMNIGQSRLPTCQARILHMLASRNRSFKIAEALRPQGTLVHDRQAAIVVDTRHEASTVPMSITLRGLQDPPRERWNVELADHRDLTTVLAGASLLNAIETSESDRTPVAFEAVSRVHVAGVGVRQITERGYMEAGPVSGRELLSLRAFRLMEAALNNPFTRSRVQSIQMELTFSFGPRYATIIDAAVPVNEVDPGAMIPITVRERRFDQSERLRVIEFRVPEQAAGTTLRLFVHSGATAPVELSPATSLAGILDNIEEFYPANSIVISARLPQRGLRFRGHLAENLPRSALASLVPTNRSEDVHSFASHARSVVETDDLMRGSTALRIRVRQNPREP